MLSNARSLVLAGLLLALAGAHAPGHAQLDKLRRKAEEIKTKVAGPEKATEAKPAAPTTAAKPPAAAQSSATAETGDAAANQTLSEKRAAAVKA